MSEPSVKGTLIQGAVEALRDLEASGRLDRQQLAGRLKPDDLELLDGDVVMSGWYPVATYGRLLEALGQSLGRGDDAWFIESGRENARRLVELGVYRQLDERGERWEERVGKLLLSVAGLLWNFGRWEWLGMDDNGFRIQVAGARPLPRVYALRTQGFVEFLASRAAGGPVRIQMTRSPDGDTLAFRVHRKL